MHYNRDAKIGRLSGEDRKINGGLDGVDKHVSVAAGLLNAFVASSDATSKKKKDCDGDDDDQEVQAALVIADVQGRSCDKCNVAGAHVASIVHEDLFKRHVDEAVDKRNWCVVTGCLDKSGVDLYVPLEVAFDKARRAEAQANTIEAALVVCFGDKEKGPSDVIDAIGCMLGSREDLLNEVVEHLEIVKVFFEFNPISSNLDAVEVKLQGIGWLLRVVPASQLGAVKHTSLDEAINQQKNLAEDTAKLQRVFSDIEQVPTIVEDKEEFVRGWYRIREQFDSLIKHGRGSFQDELWIRCCQSRRLIQKQSCAPLPPPLMKSSLQVLDQTLGAVFGECLLC